MSKRAFFIIAPEGCGSYMLAEAFVSAGCTYCDKDNIDTFMREQQPDNLVVRRSLPHAGEWPDLGLLRNILFNYGYTVQFIGIIRNSYCAEKSVLHRKGKHEVGEYAEAVLRMVSFIGLDISLITYGYFVTHPIYRVRFFRNLGLESEALKEMEFYDGNAKYFR